MPFSPDLLTSFMTAALAEAHLAAEAGEVPVGAVLALDGKIIARAHNEIERRKDATAHAEILAIQAASKALTSWRLEEATLVVTLEPCPMCVGAIGLSRIGTVVYGARDSRMGALGSIFDLSTHIPGANPRVISGVQEEECLKIIKDFFAQLRKSKS